jgi:diguanylate cyclase (GGDEF)-like protein
MISSNRPTAARRPDRRAPAAHRRGWADGPPVSALLNGLQEGLLVGGAILLVLLIALLDYETGPHYSFGIFYLIPVAACAWWGGLSPGILLALAAALGWHMVELMENPLIPLTAQVWNGVARFGMLVLTSSLISRLHGGMRRERLLARTDPLTGAANARTFYEAAAAEAERARRSDRPLTVAYLDLDNFKQLNDGLGHAAGDAALLHVVERIRQDLRGSDLLARLGGDEFGLLLPGVEPEGAAALLARLQGILAEEMERKGLPVTLSIGAITFHNPHADVDRMVHQVDALMYEAKRKGKGRLEHTVVREQLRQEWPGCERRATARVLCDRVARVRRGESGDAPEEFAMIRDLSALGVGLYLDRRLPLGSLLIIEPLAPGAKALLARVLHASEEEGRWRHGCELSTRLSDDDLRSWLGGRPAAAT